MENSVKNKQKIGVTTHTDPRFLPKKNSQFVQIQDNSLSAIQKLIATSPISAQILFFFIEKMGNYNNSVICSYQTLMEITGYSRPTVARAIKHLKSNHWIDTVKVGSATAYCVNAQVAWRHANNQKHYAIFSSTVVATSSENPNFKSDKQLRHIPREVNMLTENSPEPEQIDLVETIDQNQNP